LNSVDDRPLHRPRPADDRSPSAPSMPGAQPSGRGRLTSSSGSAATRGDRPRRLTIETWNAPRLYGTSATRMFAWPSRPRSIRRPFSL
jgi:hypothetical protein